MALLPIVVAPDPRLKARAVPVEKVDRDIVRLMDDMLETMYAAPGVGLAAPQVGVLKRIIVIDAADRGEPPAPLRMANPEIIWASEETAPYEEGCLSLPDHYELVDRPARVRVRYLDHQNEVRELEADGLLAVVVQHEIDHLEGTLFVDHISSLKRNMILRKLTKSKKNGTLEAEYVPATRKDKD
ncbi:MULTISPECIES: peptide deformylase [unclassified Haematospirillum]|uniref:peptide deformylase n=1 Tax=unclassified Haematospirillum TaxID=2622088 RepID=UPI00143BEEC9|nr:MULTISPECIES: peptide deformylase [unclassified Haematospirillum]NKD55675.1 peptide deformylase [Haematospirillum sp. H4890]NKD75200.1 peptide deformylase [Haematospirillum sp. H4485]NKD88545.1 peptide deformylase [Haematospirillum sp. 15-248]